MDKKDEKRLRCTGTLGKYGPHFEAMYSKINSCNT
jgi:hypothetical protein